jgi:hypothetical protein
MTDKGTGDIGSAFMDAAIGQLDTAMGHANDAGARLMDLHHGQMALATDLTKLTLGFVDQTARRLQALGRNHIEQAHQAFKAAAAAPTPAEVMAIQMDFARTLSSGLAAEMACASEAAMAHSGAIFEAMTQHLGPLATRDTATDSPAVNPD